MRATFFAAVVLLAACGSSSAPAPVGPTSGSCGKGCEGACDERCSTTMAQCEAQCDAQSPLDMGKTSTQSSLPREENPVCRRNCESQDQTCIRTCKAECRPCE